MAFLFWSWHVIFSSFFWPWHFSWNCLILNEYTVAIVKREGREKDLESCRFETVRQVGLATSFLGQPKPLKIVLLAEAACTEQASIVQHFWKYVHVYECYRQRREYKRIPLMNVSLLSFIRKEKERKQRRTLHACFMFFLSHTKSSHFISKWYFNHSYLLNQNSVFIYLYI